MTNQEIITAIAELDGRTSVQWCSAESRMSHQIIGIYPKSKTERFEIVPNYLTSRDAIVPVIEKQFNSDNSFADMFILKLYVILDTHELSLTDMLRTDNQIQLHLMLATPAQLCEALLRATGKWKE